VNLPFNTKGKPVTNYREMSKTAKGDAQSCVVLVGCTGKLQSRPEYLPIKTKTNLKGLVINLILIYRRLRLNLYIYIYIHYT